MRMIRMGNFWTTLYLNSPVAVQNLAISLYGRKKLRTEFGEEFHQLLETFEARQWWSAREIEDFQSERLRELIAYCYSNVSFYRTVMDERGLRPNDIETLADLTKLPVVDKNDIRKHGSEMISSQIPRSQLVYGHTSGTTGTPLQLYWDRRCCVIKNVVDWRAKKLAGINFGDRVAIIGGRIILPAQQKKPPFWRINRAANQVFFSAFHMSQKNLPHYASGLRKLQPVALESYLRPWRRSA